MKVQRDPWEDAIRRKAGAYRPEPESGFGEIASRLEFRQNRRKGWYRAVAATLVVLVGLMMWLVVTDGSEGDPLMADAEQISEIDEGRRLYAAYPPSALWQIYRESGFRR